MSKRKIIQISAAAYQGCGVYALCDDGSLWEKYSPTALSTPWVRITEIPQDEQCSEEEEAAKS